MADPQAKADGRQRCPRCGSPDTIEYPWKKDWFADLIRQWYPSARKCVDCENVWW